MVLHGEATPDELRRHARGVAGRVQGARPRPRAGRDPEDRHRQGAALAAGRAALGGRPVRFAVLGAGAIGAYVGAALARGGRGRHPDRPRRAPAGDGGARRPRPQPARRLRGPPGGHLRDRGDRGRRRRRARAEGVQPARSSHPGSASCCGRARWSSRPRTGSPGGTSRACVVRSPAAWSRASTLVALSAGRSLAERVVGCVVYCSTEIAEPGVIRHIEGTRFSIGTAGGGPDDTCRSDLRGVRRRRAQVPRRR